MKEFKVGDKVYCPMLKTGEILIVENTKEIPNYSTVNTTHPLQVCYESNYQSFYRTGIGFYDIETVFHATDKNFQALQMLYTSIKFEEPPEELKGSDLCRAMLDNDWQYVPCYVSDESDAQSLVDKYIALINKIDRDIFYDDVSNVTWFYAVPFDPKTGKLLISEEVGL